MKLRNKRLADPPPHLRPGAHCLQASQLEQVRLEQQAVLTEQAELQARHSLRDDWMEALQVLAQVQRAEQAAHQAQLAALTTAACGSDGAQASQAALQLAAWLEAAARGSGQLAASGRYVPTLAEAMASALRTSPGMLAALRAITPAKLAELYNSVVARLAELLVAVESQGCKAAERQVTDLMVEAVSVLWFEASGMRDVGALEVDALLYSQPGYGFRRSRRQAQRPRCGFRRRHTPPAYVLCSTPPRPLLSLPRPCSAYSSTC